jgi:hypothetical protein
MIFSIELDSKRGDWTRFSTPRTTPWGVRIPTAVEPSYGKDTDRLEEFKASQILARHLDSFNSIFHCRTIVMSRARRWDMGVGHLGTNALPAKRC